MPRLKLYESGPDYSANHAICDPLAVVRPSLAGGTDPRPYWYRLGYRFAFSSPRAKEQANIPRYWSPCPELAAYLDGKDDRQAEKPASGPRDYDRTGLVVPSANDSGGVFSPKPLKVDRPQATGK